MMNVVYALMYDLTRWGVFGFMLYFAWVGLKAWAVS